MLWQVLLKNNFISKKTSQGYSIPDILSRTFSVLKNKGYNVTDYGEVTNFPGFDLFIKFGKGDNQGIIIYNESSGNFRISAPKLLGTTDMKSGAGSDGLLKYI